MTSPAAQVFVYYRIRVADAAAAVAEIAAFQVGLRASMPGLCGNLGRRVDGNGEFLTLMETYAQSGAPKADWHLDIERQAQERLAAWIVGERHIEVFVPCA